MGQSTFALPYEHKIKRSSKMYEKYNIIYYLGILILAKYYKRRVRKAKIHHM